MSLFSGLGKGRLALAAAIGAGGLALTAGGVYAGLNASASNTSAQSVTSGILSLTMADNGAGFGQSVANMAPGDTVNRYVDLTNGAQLDAQALTLYVSDGSPTKLTTDATNGLHVTVTQCAGGSSPAWVPSTGVCGGTGASTSVLANNVALSGLSSSTPATLVAGQLAKGTVLHLQISLTLPNQTETTVNGNLPANTIQGLSAALTWTFNEAQRTATTTHS